jgi:ribose transport system permease protein
MAIFRSLTLYISGAGEFRSQSDLFPQLGMGYFLGIPIPVWIFIGLAVLFWLILNHTKYGRYMCAIGSNERVAKYAAIKIDKIRFFAYVIIGITVAVTAVLLSSRLNSISSSNAGQNYELDAIAAVIIGGTSMSGGSGSIIGTVIGAIILGIVNNMLNMLGVSPYLQGTVKGLVIIGAVLIQRKNNK